MAPSYCSVPGCSSNRKNMPYLSFHDFPADLELRASWVRAMRRDEGPQFKILRGSTFLCSLHFTEEDMSVSASGRKKLKKGAVPSRFIWNDLGKGKPAYEMMECEPDWAPSLNLGHNEVKAKTARRKRIGGKATRTQKQPICSTGDLLMGALDTSEAMQDNIIEVTVGETGAVVDPTNVTRDESPSTMHSSEEHHPVGSWEQATVEAITDMGSLNTTDTGTQIAQATIADLKDENDCLRVQNVNLRSELRLMQWEREQQLRDLQERLEALRQRCSCGAMSDSAKSEVASVATDGDGC
ncbi:uncharacterized protein LOC134069258 isoform X2 [Sardina pilchardus]|uniref:uncharacterized protein LOC134069258 isoform X2 n=1 Tax=Sardina pilchardus TaxID=27697 RepID=UPI002E12AF94